MCLFCNPFTISCKTPRYALENDVVGVIHTGDVIHKASVSSIMYSITSLLYTLYESSLKTPRREQDASSSYVFFSADNESDNRNLCLS